jgi:3-hydroxyacyl-CoA dehydrogenase
VVGLHFFSPANVMRLLEVVRGRETSTEVLASAMQLGKRLKKVAVAVGVCDGFVGNRMIFQYGRQAEFLLEEGASPAQVDAALRDFGMAMGPLAVRDLSGLDISHAIRERQRPGLEPGQTLPTVLDHLYAAGMLGQKTGAGFYLYPQGSRTPQDNPALPAMLEQAAATRGIVRQPVTNEHIVERCLFALVNEAARILDEGIAQRASDVDLIFLNGYGFPAWRGGPLFHADRLGLDHVLQRIREFHQRFGAWWEPAPLLERLVAEGRRFADL